MLFLVSVTLLLFSVLVTVAHQISKYNEEMPNPDNFLYVLPDEAYQKAIFITAAVINLFTCCFFILPVL